MVKGERAYQLRALTDLWTGSVTDNNGKLTDKPTGDRLITTGLLGSIRWWCEVLVRGLGGSACDPSDSNSRCPDQDGKHCVVCELFGCTGWARKFRFEVLDENSNAKTVQIKQNQIFSLRFTPLRPIRREEWALLDATLLLIAEYGAIGGKTVFKPTDESSRATRLHHKDYGLVQMVTVNPPIAGTNVTEAKKYLCEERWRKPEPKAKDVDFAWASLQHFWCVNGKYLGRVDNNKSTFNQVLGRQEVKYQAQQLAARNDGMSRWLAGSQQESKKVFSFKNPARTFGFVKPRLIDFNAIKGRLTNVWGQKEWDFLTGDNIINLLFTGKEGQS